MSDVRADEWGALTRPTKQEREDAAAVASKSALLWRRQCAAEGWPCITVRTRAGRADVELDLDPAGLWLTTAGMDAAGALFPRHRVQGSYGRAHLRTLRAPTAAAEAFAADLWALVRTQGNTGRPDRVFLAERAEASGGAR
jgi:hypothetical protein